MGAKQREEELKAIEAAKLEEEEKEATRKADEEVKAKEQTQASNASMQKVTKASVKKVEAIREGPNTRGSEKKSIQREPPKALADGP